MLSQWHHLFEPLSVFLFSIVFFFWTLRLIPNLCSSPVLFCVVGIAVRNLWGVPFLDSAWERSIPHEWIIQSQISSSIWISVGALTSILVGAWLAQKIQLSEMPRPSVKTPSVFLKSVIFVSFLIFAGLSWYCIHDWQHIPLFEWLENPSKNPNQFRSAGVRTYPAPISTFYRINFYILPLMTWAMLSFGLKNKTTRLLFFIMFAVTFLMNALDLQKSPSVLFTLITFWGLLCQQIKISWHSIKSSAFIATAISFLGILLVATLSLIEADTLNRVFIGQPKAGTFYLDFAKGTQAFEFSKFFSALWHSPAGISQNLWLNYWGHLKYQGFEGSLPSFYGFNWFAHSGVLGLILSSVMVGFLLRFSENLVKKHLPFWLSLPILLLLCYFSFKLGTSDRVAVTFKLIIAVIFLYGFYRLSTGHMKKKFLKNLVAIILPIIAFSSAPRSSWANGPSFDNFEVSLEFFFKKELEKVWVVQLRGQLSQWNHLHRCSKIVTSDSKPCISAFFWDSRHPHFAKFIVANATAKEIEHLVFLLEKKIKNWFEKNKDFKNTFIPGQPILRQIDPTLNSDTSKKIDYPAMLDYRLKSSLGLFLCSLLFFAFTLVYI